MTGYSPELTRRWEREIMIIAVKMMGVTQEECLAIMKLVRCFPAVPDVRFSDIDECRAWLASMLDKVHA